MYTTCSLSCAQDRLKSAGTDPRYKGLFDSVEKLVRPQEKEWKHAVPLVDAVRVGALTQAMVNIDHHFDNLVLTRKAGWQTPKDHPDVDPAHEALQMLEQNRELRRQPAMMKKPANFKSWLEVGEIAAYDLEKMLRQAKRDKKLDTVALDRVFVRVTGACTACHAKYRD